MTGFSYLGALLVALAAMALIDARWRLAFWRYPGAAAAAVAVGAGLLVLWDTTGIAFGVFFRGDSPYATGIELAPELPLEEPVFLVFLCYLTLITVLGVERMLAAHGSRVPRNQAASRNQADAPDGRGRRA